MSFDAAGNLYLATFFYQKPHGHVFRFAPGATTGTDLGLSAVGDGDALACDHHGNLYVGDGGSIFIYASGHKSPSKTINEMSTMPSQFALTREGAIYEPISGKTPGQSTLLEFAPHGMSPVNAITGAFEEPVGAALRAEAF